MIDIDSPQQFLADAEQALRLSWTLGTFTGLDVWINPRAVIAEYEGQEPRASAEEAQAHMAQALRIMTMPMDRDVSEEHE